TLEKEILSHLCTQREGEEREMASNFFLLQLLSFLCLDRGFEKRLLSDISSDVRSQGEADLWIENSENYDASNSFIVPDKGKTKTVVQRTVGELSSKNFSDSFADLENGIDKRKNHLTVLLEAIVNQASQRSASFLFIRLLAAL
ncbi:MAG: hypothetical protein ACREBR_01160, partial [bacterium]